MHGLAALLTFRFHLTRFWLDAKFKRLSSDKQPFSVKYIHIYLVINDLKLKIVIFFVSNFQLLTYAITHFSTSVRQFEPNIGSANGIRRHDVQSDETDQRQPLGART